MLKKVATPKAPSAIGPYSQAISVNEWVFTSGQIALDLDGKLVQGDVKAQAKQVLKNLKEVLEEGGSCLEGVVKTTIFLVNINDFAAVNEVYAEFFKEHKPARSTVAVAALPKGALVEIECIALKRN